MSDTAIGPPDGHVAVSHEGWRMKSTGKGRRALNPSSRVIVSIEVKRFDFRDSEICNTPLVKPKDDHVRDN